MKVPMDLLTSVLFPDNPDVIIEDVAIENHVLIFSLRSTRLCAECPVCGCSSTKVHGSYGRKPADLPCLTFSVRLHLHVRRFLCQNNQCERKTFAEPFAGLVVAYARRTLRQTHVLRELAFSLGGKPGAHMAATLVCQVSRDTLLRLLRRSPLPPAPVPQVLGIDDWAWRRGHTYERSSSISSAISQWICCRIGKRRPWQTGCANTLGYKLPAVIVEVIMQKGFAKVHQAPFR